MLPLCFETIFRLFLDCGNRRCLFELQWGTLHPWQGGAIENLALGRGRHCSPLQRQCGGELLYRGEGMLLNA